MTPILPAATLTLLLSACALPANVVVLIPDEAGTTGEISIQRANHQDRVSDPYAAAATGTDRVFTTDEATVDTVFAGALAETPRQPAVFVLYFQTGQTVIDPRSADTLNAAIKAARGTAFADISVIGNSDSAGDENANLVLSLYRARTIRAALESAGVPPSAIDVGYYGSANPRVPRPQGVAEPENRRVEVTIR